MTVKRTRMVFLDCTTGESRNTSRVHFTVISHTLVRPRFYHRHIMYKRKISVICSVFSVSFNWSAGLPSYKLEFWLESKYPSEFYLCIPKSRDHGVVTTPTSKMFKTTVTSTVPKNRIIWYAWDLWFLWNYNHAGGYQRMWLKINHHCFKHCRGCHQAIGYYLCQRWQSSMTPMAYLNHNRLKQYISWYYPWSLETQAIVCMAFEIWLVAGQACLLPSHLINR